MNLLELENIRKSFVRDDVRIDVLLDVNLRIRKGEVVAIVGPSGSGKSTLLKIVGLLDYSDSGSIYIEGIDCANINDRKRTSLRRRFLGFVYQNYNLLPEFTALENLLIPQFIAEKNKKDAIKKSKTLLNLLGMEDRCDNYPAQLSGGEQQRVAIARGIINNPQLLLADEPTGNLDHDNSVKVFELLLSVAKKQNVATLIVTHDSELAQKADRVIILEDGKINDARAIQ